MCSVSLAVWSGWKARCLPILLSVSYFLISVTNLWDMIIRLGMCKGRMHHGNDQPSNSHCKRAQTLSFLLDVTVKRQSKSNISDEICLQYLSEWCYLCHTLSGQCARRIDLNDNRHAEFTHVSYCTTRCTDLVHMVEIFEIACGMSWKLRRRSCIKNGEKVEL